MKGLATSKVVTSGRLTGKVKVQPTRRRAIPNPGPAPCPEPAYSLYSTDSEDQVTSLHKGLDRCAALLSGILQADKSDLPGLHRAVKGAAAKSRPSTSLGKKTVKKPPTQTGKKSCQSVQRGAGSTTPRTRRKSAAPAAHSGVKLHPPQKRPQTELQSHLPPPHVQTPQHLSPSTPPPQTSIPPPQPQTECQSASEAPHTHCQAECDGDEEDFVPVRDINTRSTAADSHMRTSTFEMSNMQLEPGHVDGREDTRGEEVSCAEGEGKVKMVQYLLGELKTLIAGEGSVAERLLSRLEQTVSSPLINAGSLNIQTEPDLSSLQSQNTQLRRRVRVLHEQLKEREKAEGRSLDTLCNSEGRALSTLQEELTAAQVRLQELQDDLTELREALQVTRSQLRDGEAKNALIASDLEATRSRLLDSEREKSELASLAQHRLEEIGHLNRALQSRSSSDCTTFVDSSASDAQRRRDPAEPATDRITHYLRSLAQPEPAHTEHVAAERAGDAREQNRQTSVQLSDTLSHAHVRPQCGAEPAETSARRHNSHLGRPLRFGRAQPCGRLSHSTLSECDAESVWSDWSTRSGSTFDTRDEAAFRDGLSALDASIASLQKTLQLDLWR